MTCLKSFRSQNFLKQKSPLQLFFFPSSSLLEPLIPKACNTARFVGKLSCMGNGSFVNCQDIFGEFSWFKKEFHFLDIKFRVFENNKNKDCRLLQLHTMRDVINFNQFMRLRNQIFVAAENFSGTTKIC